ncbi:coiled-coil domain-containing protein 40 [Drosophila nasuta]|uniref:Coiled-coil domain-containing protein 40 n=1 Tax=Drosophila albomicans TaxID=7291 RepID=A0A6P8W523_DROAB|nr:coiled-coil domain-containing protein 40 [Drosophila albomicans]XP_060661040.1 coiled-coil domain-containing protein 40 [Drosophila nasuta]
MEDTEDQDSCDFANISDADPQPALEPEEMSILPPNHPLLRKFQQSLKEHLLRTKYKLENEITDIKYQVKQKEDRREAQGLALYDMQNKITYQEQQIKEISTQIDEHIEKRQEEEAAVEIIKKEYEEKVKLTRTQKSLYQTRMMELEDLQSLGSNIKQWAYDVEDEVKNAKRIVSRDAQLQKQLSEEKRKSDILFYRLDMEVKKKEAELESIIEDGAAIREVVNVLNMSIADANTDLEALQNEHKRLVQAWSEVIIAIQQRDKILFQVQDNIRKQKEAIKLSLNGVEAVKKQIAREMQLNKKLESFKQRMVDDMNTLSRDCQREAENLTGLQNKLDEFPDFLARTEADLQEATREGHKLMSEIRRLDFVLDKNHQKKFKTEEAILKLAQEQLITDKASGYRLKLLNKAQEQRRSVDLSLSKVQNQLSLAMLDVEQLRGVLYKSRNENDVVKENLNKAEQKSDCLEDELKRMQTKIDIKMQRFEKLNSQIEEIQSAFGDETGNPTELKIKQIEKSIHIGEHQIREHQQFWIMLQNHYVNLTHKRSDQLHEIQVTRKQLSIIKQKSLKVEQELEISESKTRDLKLDIQKFTSKLELLNEKIYNKRKNHDTEESEYEHEQAELSQRLKDTEAGTLKLEKDINDLQNEIELNKDLVLDSHREALSWETKHKLIEETINWSKSESSLNGEIGAMKIEIHRMNIRHSQLKRAQEKLVQDLEHCVMHREQIFVNASVKEHIDAKKKRFKNSSQAQVKLEEVRNKTKAILNEIAFLADNRIVDSVSNIEKMIYILRKIQADLTEVTSKDTRIQAQIEDAILMKHANLEQIIRKQNRAKAFRKLSTSKGQLKIVRSESVIQQQLENQLEMNDTLMEIIQTLTNDYPEKKTFFSKIVHFLKE